MWVGLGAGLDGYGEEENVLPPLGFEPRTFQRVSSRYTEYATLMFVRVRGCVKPSCLKAASRFAL